MSNYNIWIEKVDGTKFAHPSDKIYPSQLNDWVEGYLSTYPGAEVLTTVWKHDKGEVRKKFYSPTCWTIDLLAIEMFEDLCKNHDWYYAYSDDHRVYKKGHAADIALKHKYNSLRKSNMGATIEAIFDQYAPKSV
jgi:hypothetical protein